MAKRKTERLPVVAQPMAAAMSQNYEALITAIAQAHDHAQRQAVQATNVALTLRNQCEQQELTLGYCRPALGVEPQRTWVEIEGYPTPCYAWRSTFERRTPCPTTISAY